MDQKQILIDDNLLTYYTNSNINKPVLLFIHGWGSNSELWFKVFNNEFKDKFNIYCLDLPGFGKSELKSDNYTLDKYLETILQFIQKLELKDITYIGHSLGGRIGIKFGSNNQINKILNNLILVDSAGINHNDNSINSKSKNILKPLKVIFNLPLLSNFRESIIKLWGSDDYINFKTLRNTFKNIVNEDLTPRIPLININTLIIWGENDDNPATPLSDAHFLNNNIKNSKLEIIENAKHFPFLDNSDKFREVLIKYINE